MLYENKDHQSKQEFDNAKREEIANMRHFSNTEDPKTPE